MGGRSSARPVFGSTDSGADVLHDYRWVPLGLAPTERGDTFSRLSFCVNIPEQTAGEVLQMGGPHEEAPRKVWGMNPDSQVLRVLQEAELQPLTLPMENATICEEDTSVPGGCSF